MRSDDRRTNARFRLSPMHTAIRIGTDATQGYTLDGHAYDISETGICFELDAPIPAGTTIAMRIELPGTHPGARVSRPIDAIANVIWLDDSGEPGPARMAAAFTRFALPGDADRLRAQIEGDTYRRAA